MTGGNVYNRPRSALQKNLKRAGRLKKQQKKRQSSSKALRVKEDLVTSHILRKTKTNPKANITLSGKKKRLLLKQLKREQKEKLQMDLDQPNIKETKSEPHPQKQEKEKMDVS